MSIIPQRLRHLILNFAVQLIAVPVGKQLRLESHRLM